LRAQQSASASDDKRLVKASKYLARHLRHDPGRLGLSLDRGGWVRVDALLNACALHDFALTRHELVEVVERNDKQRFSFDATGDRIRANQGHSVDVDLGLAIVRPPSVLFHGTVLQRLDEVMGQGLRRMRRHHVHLSPDVDSARKVGARHGQPVVLEVAAGEMHDAGFAFLLSDNGVWLTGEVPPGYLRRRCAARSWPNP
jgi:putative RNA 2'-phosphotransferase